LFIIFYLLIMVQFTLLAALLAVVPSVFAHPANGPRATKFGCGTAPSPAFLAQAAKFEELEAANDNSSRISIADVSAARATITIQTYFHVVAKSTSLSGGYVPQSQLNSQIAVMNSNYGR
jgi:hypothetical protein